MGFLIDTNVLSELRKGKNANVGVQNWFETISDDQLYISVLTLGEIRQGIEQIKRRDVQAATALIHDLTLVTRVSRILCK